MGMEVVFDTAARLIGLVQQTQCGNIRKAAELIADSFMAGGILQAFGSGHSNAGARELCGYAIAGEEVQEDHEQREEDEREDAVLRVVLAVHEVDGFLRRVPAAPTDLHFSKFF